MPNDISTIIEEATVLLRGYPWEVSAVTPGPNADTYTITFRKTINKVTSGLSMLQDPRWLTKMVDQVVDDA